MAKAKHVCTVRGCENHVTSYTRLGICNACYAYLYYWQKKTPKAVVQRMHKLHLFEERLAALSGVSVLEPHKRKRKRA